MRITYSDKGFQDELVPVKIKRLQNPEYLIE
jgi:hypothetical protein